MKTQTQKKKKTNAGRTAKAVVCSALVRLVRELRREADEQSDNAQKTSDVTTKEYLRGLANGRRESAMRIANMLRVSDQRELAKSWGNGDAFAAEQGR